MNKIKDSIVDFCNEIGADPLIVQGAGGNVSWKDGETLWVKGSGTWLSDARDKDIFLPVDLVNLIEATKNKSYSNVPSLISSSELKPSIETVLHALMPSKIVIHLHSIEILSQLVRKSCRENIAELLKGKFKYVIVDYHKPGDQLAAAVHRALEENCSTNIIFLKNHGVVIGGESVEEVSWLLKRITEKLRSPVLPASLNCEAPSSEIPDYIPVSDFEIHRLATEKHFYELISKFWILYPDHAVFLGEKPYTFANWDAVKQLISSHKQLPELIFIEKVGVFISYKFNKVMLAQLRCYYDVIARQTNDADLEPLTHDQISELLNWEAEKFRIQVSERLANIL